MAVTSTIGIALMIAGIVLFLAGFALDTDSSARSWTNWLAIVMIYFGLVMTLTPRLLENRHQ